MRLSIRRARPDDIARLAGPLLEQAERRREAAPGLWPLAPDARERIEKSLAADVASSAPAPPHMWLIAEAAGRIVGATHAVIIPPPPIYEPEEGKPGLVLNDSFVTGDRPAEAAADLLAATEAELKAAGAGGLIGACLAAGVWRDALEDAGYEAVTLYLAKSGLGASAPDSRVRAAAEDDIPTIVALSAAHRATLQQLNPRFWRLHPDADRRFELWMRHSLTLADRDMLVAGPPGRVDGYVIAQPITRLHAPAGHDLTKLGIVDDFYTEDFRRAGPGEALLAAAETAFTGRGVAAALAICPAAWASKAALLERAGYRAALLWMLKRA